MLALQTLAQLADRYPEALRARVSPMTLRSRTFDFESKPAIMGVVNLSPDSWYRESVCLSTTKALDRARLIAAQGADIIDIGAESTLAQAARVGQTDQNRLLTPLISELSQEGLLISVETYSPDVAALALKQGAAIINLTGSSDFEPIFKTVADHDAGVIICYVQGKNVREVTDYRFGSDPIGASYEYFARAVETASRAGVTRMFIDPGLGFYYRNLQDSATRVRHQMQVFLNTFRLRALGQPICHALPHAFEFFGEEVRCAEAFFAVLASLGKTDLFRTHEVPKVKAVLETLHAW